ncbi:hypothetical protein K8I28_08845 [bacterium]|nr:hypothetical protein [bacterium]
MRRSFGSLCIILILIVTVGVGNGYAQGFGTPSNVAGVWKMTLGTGTHLVSFPLLPENATLETVLGDQLPGGTEWENASWIQTFDGNSYIGSYYDSNQAAWVGDLTDLNLTQSYWMQIIGDQEGVTLELIGAALDAETISLGEMRVGMNMISAGFPFPTSLAESGLIESSFASGSYEVTSDRIYSWSAGNLNSTWHSPSQGWQGTQSGFMPWQGYILVVAPGHREFEWERSRPAVQYGGNEGRYRLDRKPGRTKIPLPDFKQPPWDKKKIDSEKSNDGSNRSSKNGERG